MKSIDPLLSKVPRPGYNCMDLVRDGWLHLTGEDIHDHLTTLRGAIKDRKSSVSGRRAFKRLVIPESPCIVVMQRKRFVPHVGIYIDGSVLHLAEHGTEFTSLDLAKRYFKTLRFYR